MELSLGTMSDGKFHGNQHTLEAELEYDYTDLVADIRALADELGRPPTTRDAESDQRLPSIKKMYRLLDDREWNDLLENAGVGETQIGEYARDERPAILQDIRRVFEETDVEYLTVREYDQRGNYNKSVLKRLFGRWSAACSQAGVAHGRRHGRHVEGPNGAILDSKLEAEIAQAIKARGFEYVPHKGIPDTSWTSDFYLPVASFWIEVDGYQDNQRPNQSSFEEKLRYYGQNGMMFAVVSDILELDEKVFQRILPKPE